MVFKVRQMTDEELSVSNPHLVFCLFTVARYYIGISILNHLFLLHHLTSHKSMRKQLTPMFRAA